MLHTLQIKNFTIFSEAQFEFSPGINVIIGDNGTGKSHLLYLAYVIESVLHDYLSSKNKNQNKDLWQRGLAEKLKKVFQPEKLGRLCRLQKRQHAEIKMVSSLLGQPELTTAFSFFVTAKKKVKMAQYPSVSYKHLPKPVFLPSFLSFYPQAREVGLSNTIYDDFCQALNAKSAKGKGLKKMADLVAPLEEILQGKVVMNFDKFYLQSAELGKMEMSLVPEGLRKIAMLSYLLSNGGLAKGSTLFWDEPELNLNARLQVKLVDTLVALVKAGVQVVVTTHDLFLMKELSLRVLSSKVPTNFFSLHNGDKGIEVEQGTQLDDLYNIVALDAGLAQYDREQDVFYNDIFEPEA